MWRDGAYLTLVSVQNYHCFTSIYSENGARGCYKLHPLNVCHCWCNGSVLPKCNNLGDDA